MEVRAYLKYICISPHRVSVVSDLIRGKEIDLAVAILEHTPKTTCEDLQELLKSTITDAKSNHNMDVTRLYVVECLVSPGPILKCIRSRTQGRVFRILKRTPHVTLALKEKE